MGDAEAKPVMEITDWIALIILLVVVALFIGALFWSNILEGLKFPGFG